MVLYFGRNAILMMLVCLLGINIVAGAPHRRVVLSPREDSFYSPPSGFEKEKPGTILKSRALPPKALAAFSAFPQNLANVYQFLYRTTDGLGKPTATVTTLMVPYKADPSKLVTYQVMIDSPDADCGPSHVLQTGDGIKGIVTQTELLYMDTLLERGWYIVTSDFQGPHSAFGVGLMAGQAVLDSIRAVLSSGKQTKIRADADVQMWGYSGGALATGWAAQLHSSYAPELNIVGASFGGTVVNLNSTLKAVNKSMFSGFGISGVLGLSQQYSELADYVDGILLPKKKSKFYKAKDLCLTGLLADYAFQDFGSYVNRPDYINDPIVKKVLDANVMGKLSAPKFPVFMYHAKHDQVIPYQPAYDMYTNWCKKGANIQFVRDELSEHVVLFITGSANAIRFLEARFKGDTFKAGCSQRTTITSALDPGALSVFGRTIFDALVALLGRPIGPGTL